MKPKKKFLIATYYEKPNGKYDEVIELRNAVKTRHLQTALVILDCTDKKLVVQRMKREENVSYDTLFNFYYELNKARIDKFLAE